MVTIVIMNTYFHNIYPEYLSFASVSGMRSLASVPVSRMGSLASVPGMRSLASVHYNEVHLVRFVDR